MSLTAGNYCTRKQETNGRKKMDTHAYRAYQWPALSVNVRHPRAAVFSATTIGAFVSESAGFWQGKVVHPFPPAENIMRHSETLLCC